MDKETIKQLLIAFKMGMKIKETTLVLDSKQCEFLYEQLKHLED